MEIVFHMFSLVGQLLIIYTLSALFNRNARIAFLFFIIVPVALFPVWVMQDNQPIFGWVKLISVIIACIWINLLRLTKLGEKRFLLNVIIIIFIGNILEAMIQNIFEPTVVNLLNSLLGILLVGTICFKERIFVSYEDQSNLFWFGVNKTWIVAYSLWNLVFIYNHFQMSFYYHLIVLAIPLLFDFLRPGIWGQTRAYTLAIWMLLQFTFSDLLDSWAWNISANDYLSHSGNLIAVILLLALVVKRMKNPIPAST